MAETWVLNATITVSSHSFSAAFTSNGTEFSTIYMTSTALYYRGTKNIKVYTNWTWADSAYRTLVFDSSPTGDLLTWLQANGVKQSDPEPETPTNSCMVDGTVYGIKTGTALVNGTARTIYNGRTLVAGAGYDIVLSSSEFTVTITGTGTLGQLIVASVGINGTTYTSAATVEVANGTTITLRTNARQQNSRSDTKIVIDGVTVAQGTTSHAASYIYTPTGNITIKLSIEAPANFCFGIITVTTS